MKPNHITISTPPTVDEAKAVSESVKAGVATYCVNPRSASIAGREKMLIELRSAGCEPEVVRELGWATVHPDSALSKGDIRASAEVKEEAEAKEAEAPKEEEKPDAAATSDDDGSAVPPGDAPNTRKRSRAKGSNRNRNS